MVSVIIPAHNEGAVIARTLQSILGQLAPEDELIVVANGCTDDTAAVARSFGPRVLVIETDIPSKTHALNLGDAQARYFPRIYADADICLSEGSIAALGEALQGPHWLAVSPDPVMLLEQSSWAVRAYYEIWLALPYCRAGMIGAGVYALSKAGRARFGEFPPLIADDGFVRAQFSESERGRVLGAKALVRAPSSLSWLLKIKTRSRLGSHELALRHPELLRNEAKDYSGALAKILGNPRVWPKAIVYLLVNLLSRRRASRQVRTLATYRWEKDWSTRQIATGGADADGQ